MKRPNFHISCPIENWTLGFRAVVRWSPSKHFQTVLKTWKLSVRLRFFYQWGAVFFITIKQQQGLPDYAGSIAN